MAVYIKLTLAYLTLSIGMVLAFLFFCSLARNDPSLAASNGLVRKLAQVGYRYSHPAIQYVCGRYDPELAYTLAPGVCRYSDTEYDIEVRANSAGLRDDEDSLKSPDIVMLGDSHTLGLGVEAGDIFATRVEEGAGLKVLNAGVSSYGTARELQLLRRLAAHSAKYIVIQYCRNDFEENRAYVESDGRLHIMSGKKYRETVAVQQHLQESFVAPGLGVVARFTEKVSAIGASLFWKKTEAIEEAEAFAYVLSRNRDILDGKKVIILDINGHNRNDNMFIEHVRPRLGGLGLDLHFIETDRFLTADDYYILDNHMTAAGHEKVANAILQAIASEHSRRAAIGIRLTRPAP